MQKDALAYCRPYLKKIVDYWYEKNNNIKNTQIVTMAPDNIIFGILLTAHTIHMLYFILY